MTEEMIGDFLGQAMMLICIGSGPILIACTVLGLLVGLLQAATQIQEPVTSFVAKFLVVGGAMWIGGAWALSELAAFLRAVLEMAKV